MSCARRAGLRQRAARPRGPERGVVLYAGRANAQAADLHQDVTVEAAQRHLKDHSDRARGVGGRGRRRSGIYYPRSRSRGATGNDSGDEDGDDGGRRRRRNRRGPLSKLASPCEKRMGAWSTDRHPKKRRRQQCGWSGWPARSTRWRPLPPERRGRQQQQQQHHHHHQQQQQEQHSFSGRVHDQGSRTPAVN